MTSSTFHFFPLFLAFSEKVVSLHAESKTSAMNEMDIVFAAIATDGFSAETLQMIDNFTNDIRYGRKDFNGFTLPEHAGLCKGGAPLIGASIVAGYARRSLATGGNAQSSEGGSPANWQIDEAQERLIEEWTRAKGLWFEHSESIIEKNFGPMIAQGAEAKVSRALIIYLIVWPLKTCILQTYSLTS